MIIAPKEIDVKNRLLRQARKIQFIADWLDIRAAKRDSQALHARLENGLREAKKRNASREEFDMIRGQYQAESEIIWHPVYERASEKLVRKARKLSVRVPPLPPSYEGNDDWQVSPVTGDSFLSAEGEERLKREIMIATREKYDEFRKWAAVVLSLAAFCLAWVSLRAKQNQPDPCPRNYYRSDSGECVFALQKAATPQAPITPLPNPAKPPKTAKP